MTVTCPICNKPHEVSDERVEYLKNKYEGMDIEIENSFICRPCMKEIEEMEDLL